MWIPAIFISSLLIVASGIKVPIDRSEEVRDEESLKESIYSTQVSPTYYISEDANPDIYPISSEPQKPDDEFPDIIVTPATYLLPPTQGKPEYYYKPTEPIETDWYPIAQAAPIQSHQLPSSNDDRSQSEGVPRNTQIRKSKSHDSPIVPVPSTGLEPPHVDARNDFFTPTSSGAIQLEVIQGPINGEKLIPLEEIQQPIHVSDSGRYELPPVLLPKKEPLKLNYRTKPIQPTLALHLIPPQPEKYKIPTKLYPKKFVGKFKPVPLPIAQYADQTLEIPKAKPVKLIKPSSSSEIDYLTPSDEEINYLYRKAENKRKPKGEEHSLVPRPEVSAEDTYSKYNKPSSAEQVASESHHRHPGRNPYPAPVPVRQQVSPSVPQPDAAAKAPDGRTEFRMHGMKGPHSYQFGFDTGKGKNRQFRYEERDNDGQVRGHYGYMDKHGKLRVVNYSADPKTGFHAEAPTDKE